MTQEGLKLKRSHKYFTQIQVQLFVTGRKNAKFILQTPYTITVEDIKFDEEFFFEKLRKVEENYETVFIPEFFEHRMFRKLNIVRM